MAIGKLGLTISDINLHSENHVIATPPGENALIKRLDEFLSSQQAEIKNLLQRQQEQQARK